MGNPGKGRKRTPEFMQAIERFEKAAHGGDGDSHIRHYALDGRTLPLRFAAEALQALEGWDPETSTAPLRAELHRCMDELLKLREQLPPPARQCFDALDDRVQSIELGVAADPVALADARERLVECICALGDTLLATLWPGEGLDPS